MFFRSRSAKAGDELRETISAGAILDIMRQHPRHAGNVLDAIVRLNEMVCFHLE